MKKKKKSKSKKPDKSSEKPILTKFNLWIDKHKYLPYILFFVLAFLYFAPTLFSNEAIYNTDSGLQGTGERGRDFSSFSFHNIFGEDKIWSESLGGMPTSVGLIEYNDYFISNILLMFFYDFRSRIIITMLILVLAGTCMYVFLRGMGINKIISIMLGIAYEFSPHIVSFTYAGHYSKMGVIALLPLLFHFINKGVETGKVRYFLWFGFFVGIDIFFAHLQLVHYSLLVTGFYFVFRIIYHYIKQKSFKASSIRVGLYVIAIVFGLGMGIRGFLPQYIYTKTSSKRAGEAGEGLSKDYATTWSLHAEEIASLAVPEFVNYDASNQNYYWGKNPFKLNADYFGGILFILAFISLFLFKRYNDMKFYFCLFLFGILFGLGSKSPIFSLFFNVVPGMKSFRAPSMMIFVTAFSAFALSGILLQYMFENRKDKIVKITSYTFIVLSAICLLSALDPEIILKPWRSIFYENLSGNKLQIYNANISQLSTGFLISFLFFILFGLGLLIYHKDKFRYQYLMLGLIPIFIIDFWRIDKDFLKTVKVVPGQTTLRERIDAYEFIKSNDDSLYRVIPLNHIDIRTFQTRFLYEGIKFVSGFNDFVIKRYDKVMKGLSNQREFWNFLNLSCTKYVVFDKPIEAEFLEQIYKGKSGLYVYKNNLVLSWFYIRGNLIVEKDPNKVFKMVLNNRGDLYNTTVIEKNPPEKFKNLLNNTSQNLKYDIEVVNYKALQGNVELNVNLNEPGFLVYSENYHPKWSCFIDGEEVEIYRANYLFKGIFLEAGDHKVTFRFENKLIDVTKKIMFSCMFLLFFSALFFTYRDRNERKK